ncbi:Lrp/AsnC family transcriptional regulator, partial [Streptomyces anulatus]
ASRMRGIDRVVGFEGSGRASTELVMENPVPMRIIPLVEQAAEDTDRPEGPGRH